MATILAISDIHYGLIEHGAAEHLAALRRGVSALLAAGRPDAVVLVGDIVDRADPATYAAAHADLAALFPGVPLYPATGNHEFLGAPDVAAALAAFCAAWGLERPCYRRDIRGTPLLVLDVVPEAEDRFVLRPETLAWLDAELAALGDRFAVIAEHCPLIDTVGDRDPANIADYSTTNPKHGYFQLVNSADVRALLARRPGPRLFLSGHTHSGWEAPHLVKTERLGAAPVTFANLMSPYFTGIRAGRDQPDVVLLWQIDHSPEGVRLSALDLRGGGVKRTWDVPLR